LKTSAIKTTAGLRLAIISALPIITIQIAWALGPCGCGTTISSRRARVLASHPHRDMEIITYVRSGAVSHEDSLGNAGRTEAGQVQVMSAGTGIRHAEFNKGEDDLTLFQVWIEPDEMNHVPRWDTRTFDRHNASGGFQTLVSGLGGREHADALYINQDAAFMACVMDAGEEVSVDIAPGRRAYLVPARGEVEVNGIVVPERAGVQIEREERLSIKAANGAEVVLLDLP